MRETLFRGKLFDNREWFFGDLLQNIDTLKIREQEKDIRGVARSFEVVPETVGQYTGLTDKNGKKIFEGDIVRGRFLFEMEVLSVVVFKDGAFGLEWNRGNVKEFDAFTSMCNIQYDVIGNVFDNAELLEQKE